MSLSFFFFLKIRFRLIKHNIQLGIEARMRSFLNSSVLNKLSSFKRNMSQIAPKKTNKYIKFNSKRNDFCVKCDKCSSLISVAFQESHVCEQKLEDELDEESFELLKDYGKDEDEDEEEEEEENPIIGSDENSTNDEN